MAACLEAYSHDCIDLGCLQRPRLIDGRRRADGQDAVHAARLEDVGRRNAEGEAEDARSDSEHGLDLRLVILPDLLREHRRRNAKLPVIRHKP